MLNTLFEQWSLGLYLGSHCLQSVLLRRSLGRVSVQGFWSQKPAKGATQAKQLEAFLQPIVARLLSFKKVPDLVVNLGLPHTECAWQPLPSGGPVMWQRQAAMHWQLDLTQVYLDVVPIAPKTTLLVSTPCQPLAHVLGAVAVLQSAVTKPLCLCLDADITAVLKLWPWYLKRRLVLVAWPGSDTGIFVDAAGLHECSSDDLPTQCDLLLCGAEQWQSQRSWYWQVEGLPQEMMLAWHLAYLPSVGSRSSWRPVQPLSVWQYLRLFHQPWRVPRS